MNNIDFFTKIQNHLDTQLPFVIFRKPNESIIHGFLQQTSDLRTSTDFNTSGFVFSPFVEGEDETVWMYEEECELIETEFKESGNKIDLALKKHPKPFLDKEKHISIVEKAINSLKSGDLQKVVISRSEMVEIKEREPIEWFKQIANLYVNAFCYCWYHPKVGMWLGASPETLIYLNNTSFETMALAGTMPFEGSEKVTWGIKEQEEQQLVVDSILDGLKAVSKQVQKGVTTTQKAGALLHLKTKIQGELKALSGVKVLIEVLHPTSAVCGLPKKSAKQFILENENYNRSYYTGYLGSFSIEKNTHLFVNLRCMQVYDTSIKIYVGGGITALSNAELEWDETVNKSQIMKIVL